MTKDEFRKFQKEDCHSGSPNKQGIYGCPCCRKLSNLNHFKKMSRKLAKGKLRNETRKFIEKALKEAA